MRFWVKTGLLALLLFGLSAVDFAGFGLNTALLASPGWSLLADGLSAAALGWAIVRARFHGWRLIGALFLVQYGVESLMTAIEVVYLEVLRPVLLPILVNGFVTAALFAPAAVYLHGRFRQLPSTPRSGPRLAWHSLTWKLPLLAVVWMLLFVLAGALVFLPLARQVAPELLSGYTDLPAWVLPFQGIRAVLWMLLALPILLALGGRRSSRALVLGTLFAALMGSNLLLPNPLLPAGLQLAHLAEVTLANFTFGLIAGLLLLRRDSRSERLERERQRRPVAQQR